MPATKVDFDIIARDRASQVFDRFGRRVRDTSRDTDLLTRASKGLIGAFAGYATISTATNFLRDANAEAREAQKVNALTANLVKKQGDAAFISTKQVGDLSMAISNKAAVDDEVIQSGANLLLTFHKVRNEVGKGNDVFNRATKAATDMASIKGLGGIEGAAKMLGKALADPVKGVTALNRAGVNFTQSQREQIKTLIEQNDLLGAQKLILKEVESQVGGSAAAQATAADRLSVAWSNAKEVIGTALLPVIDDFADAAANKLIPAAEKAADWFTADGAPAIKDFSREMKPLAESLLPAAAEGLDAIGDAVKTVAPGVKAIVDAFNSLPESVQKGIVIGAGAAALGNKVTGGLGPIVAVPTGGGGGKAGKAGGGSKGRGGGLGLLGTLPLLGGFASWRMDEFDKIGGLGKNTGSVDALARSMTNLGKSTKLTGQILRDDLAKSNAGAYAEQFGIDLEAVAASMDKAGTSGVAYRDTLRSLKDQLQDRLDAGLFDETTANLDFAIQGLEGVGAAYDKAGEKAVGSEERQRQLFDALLGGAGEADKLGASLDALGEKKSTPSVAVNDRASRVLDGVRRMLRDLDGDRATTYVNTVYTRSNRVAQGVVNYGKGLTKRAAGGPIYGPGTETSDSIPALLSNGEHVFTADEVRRMGGQEAVLDFRRRLTRGPRPSVESSRAPSAGVSEERLARSMARAMSGMRLTDDRGREFLLKTKGGW